MIVVKIAGLRLDLPDDWSMVTEDVPVGEPFTFMADGGLGLLQFSMVKYAGGEKPNIGLNMLKRLFKNFCKLHSFDPQKPVVLSDSRLPCVGGMMSVSGRLLAVYYLSDGLNTVFVTYTGEKPLHPSLERELPAAIKIIKSMRFAEDTSAFDHQQALD